MKMIRLWMFLFTLTALAFPALNVSGQTLSSEELQSSLVERRAVDAVIWGLPLVGEDTVKQAAFRDGKAKYNDIVWWPKGSWKNQSPTPNVNTVSYTHLDVYKRQVKKSAESSH